MAAAPSDDYTDPDDIGVNASTEPSIGELIERRLSRRDALRGLAGIGAAAALGSPFASTDAQAQTAGPSTLTFKELAHTLDADQHVADGYDMQVLIRWGDPVMAGAPAFDPANQTAAAQEKQFGYNNDFTAYLPIEGRSDRGLMVVSHEYASPHLMFDGLTAENYRDKMTDDQIRAGAKSLVADLAKLYGDRETVV